MKFELIAKDKQTKARAGLLYTSHGVIETPIFMPVGTVGSVKGVFHKTLEHDIKAQIILANTYHIYLRPGIDIITQAGGIHKFMSWDKPVLTDSGGYQIFSLSERRKLTNDGVRFSSHIDGSKHWFTPENVVDIQRKIGSDIMMALDECTPYPCTYEYAKKSMQITHQWLKRGWSQFHNTQPLYGYEQTYFPIIQGSVFKDLRIQSTEEILAYNSDGIAIGGLSVGEPVEVMYEMIDIVIPLIPENKPRYLMGVGTPANILESIERGIDMFDCVMPTRNGRNGMLFTSNGIINIKNEKWKNDFSCIDENSDLDIDKRYSKAYLRHLFVAGEMLGPIIASIHNLHFYLWLVMEARRKIMEGNFIPWKKNMMERIVTRL
ncbi:MAG: tRNA guanosine(34) transglycosylase Tgt [Bacteroidales bacterium]|nr:tRNA guanosine(34) transglycosylase Tgt [Bacteroidales bacterium]